MYYLHYAPPRSYPHTSIIAILRIPCQCLCGLPPQGTTRLKDVPAFQAFHVYDVLSSMDVAASDASRVASPCVHSFRNSRQAGEILREETEYIWSHHYLHSYLLEVLCLLPKSSIYPRAPQLSERAYNLLSTILVIEEFSVPT